MQVTLDGQTLTGFEYDKVRALLAYLAVEADRPHRREALMGLLWPDLPDASARMNLRQALATLRRAIGDRAVDSSYLLANRDTVQWNPSSDGSLDVAAFTSLLDETEQHAHRRAEHCRPCAERLQEAVQLYRGSFLAQFSLSDSVLFEEWALLKREWLHHRAVAAMGRLVTYHERRGDYEQAISAARQQLELDSWREEAHRQLMRLLVLNGERSAALAQYERCRRLLAEELGVEPEAETTTLYEQIREATPDAPVEVRRLNLPANRPHNLPPQPTPFVGREQELADLSALLDNPACRLVTLVGMGGVGKTRLALQVATEQLESFADGVHWVPLAGLHSAERLIRTIGDAVGCSFSGQEEVRHQLLSCLRDKEMLLVLDNFEHLLEEAGLLADILKAAPEVSLLVTSRGWLHLRSEWVFEVRGLPVPDPEVVTSLQEEQSSAVQLFVQSAVRAKNDWRLNEAERPWIVRICQLLEGLPLGIELAAAWVRLLSCEEIAREVEKDLAFLASTTRDVPNRHRSLQAVFDHSWRLLSEEEQRVLGELALFRGGFRREAAEQVAGAGLPLLSALLDKSLLRRNPTGRYDLHELVRQYSLQMLDEDGMLMVRTRHLRYFRELAETAEGKFTGPEQGRWLAALEAEHDNVQAALEWAFGGGDAKDGLRLAVALYRFWHWHTHLSEGRQWLRFGLAAVDEHETEEDALLRAKAFHAMGVLTDEQGAYAEATTLFEQALALRQQWGDRAGQAASLNSLGVVAWEQQALDQAQSYMEASLALRRELGQREWLLGPLNNLGVVAIARGDYEAAQAFLEESLAISRESQDQLGAAGSLLNLGTMMLDRGEPASAWPYLIESLGLHWEAAEKDGVAYCLEGLAGVFAARQHPEAALHAARLLGAAEKLRQAIGAPLSPSERPRYERSCHAARRATLDEAAFTAAWAEGQAMPLEQVIEQARG
jgi:predicted ATPase/DNA-binding SARP family transcriptional activator